MYKLIELDGRMVKLFYKKIELEGKEVFCPGKIEIIDIPHDSETDENNDLDKAA